MAALTGAWERVAAPEATTLPFGLFSVVEPRDSSEAHWRHGITWESLCGLAGITADPCNDPEVDPLDPDLECIVAEWDPFTIYAYDELSTIRGDLEWHQDRARTRLQNTEQVAVEVELTARLEAATTAESVASLPIALGYVEQMIAQLYGSQGVIHLNRASAVLLADHLRVQGSRLVTLLGTPVVAGGGIDPLPDPFAGALTVYGTGPLVMYRGSIEPLSATVVARGVNNVSALAQRDYALGWDCIAVAATTNVTPEGV